MRLPFAFLIFLFAALTASNRAIAADYALNFGGDGASSATATVSVTDAAGNTFIVGRNSSVPEFNGVPFTSFGETGIFVAKVDPAGAVVWVKGFGGPKARMEAHAIAVAPDGGVVVVGRNESGNTTIPPLSKLGEIDGFVMKLDGNGTLSWSHPFGGAKVYAFTHGVAVDSQGYVMITGHYGYWDAPTNPPLPAGDQTFAIRYDKLGTMIWARAYVTRAVSFGKIAVDANGNGYVVGSGDFPGLTMRGASDIVAFKVDASNGDVVWARNFGGPGVYASGAAIALDPAGNVFVGAQFSRNAMTTPPLSLIGEQDVALLKLDPSGNLLWGKNYGGPKVYAQLSGIAVTGNGHVLLAARQGLSGTGLTTPVLPRIGPLDAVLLEIDPAGTIVQANSFGGPGTRTSLVGIGVDGAGNRYPVGNFSGGNLTQPPLASHARFGSIFALKMDAAGATVRAREYVSTYGGEAGVTATATDSSGNLFVTGTFDVLQMNIGGVVVNPIGTRNTFVAKFDSSGSVEWAKVLGIPTSLDNTTRMESSGIAVDPVGGVYVGGLSLVLSSSSSGPVQVVQTGFVTKLDPNGNTSWTRDVGGSAITALSAIAVDGFGGVLVAGEFANGNLSSPPVVRIGATDAFVAKLDSAGNDVWARGFGGPGAKAHGKGLTVDVAGNSYLAGWFENASLTTPAMSRLGLRDALLLKIDPSGQTLWSRSFGGGNASASAYANAVAVASTGKIYIAGNFELSDLATPPLMRVSAGSHGMIIGLDAQGAIDWAEPFGAANGTATTATSVAVSGSGDVLAAVNSRSWNGLDIPGVASAGNVSTYTFRYNAQGNRLWSHSYGGSAAFTESTSIAVDNAGNVHLGGSFASGNLTSPPLVRIGGRDALVVKHGTHFGNAIAGFSMDASGPVHLGQKSIVFTTLGGSPTPTGAVVVFTDGRSCTIFLTAGLGTCQLQAGVIGMRTVTGRYTGDDQYAPQEVSVALVVKPTLDVDGNGSADSLTDGLLIMRYAFGLRGEQLTRDSIGPGAIRTDPVAIAGYLDQVRSTLDVDGDGNLDALTDGLALVRYLFGVRGDDLIRGSIGVHATRTTAPVIEAYVDSLVR